jgi:hypothetical protein
MALLNSGKDIRLPHKHSSLNSSKNDINSVYI